MKTEIKLYIWITILMLIDLIFYLTKRISFAGNLFDRMILWIWFIGTFFISYLNILKKSGLNYME